MKEMTIEQKAKAYDEAIKVAADIKAGIATYITDGTPVIDAIFPVLKESEDDKVRKKLIHLVKKSHEQGGYALHKWESDEMLAWLEKQSKKPDTDFSDLRTWKYIVDAVWTEKEGIGQYLDSPFTEEVAKKLQIRFGNIEQILANSAKTCKNEQKPADKVEPKFKVDDWVVYCGKTCKITGLHNGIFTITNQDGSYFFNKVESTTEPVWHLWTIKDANDGDVLAYNDGSLTIFRYRLSGLDAGLYMSHVLLTNKIEFKQTCAINNVHPATKEQCDFLFQKIKEAGYEWDAEKKELKKIVAPIFHIGDRVRYKEHACNGVITEITDTDYICGDAKLPISTQDKLELVEQNSAWSEEDEKNYDISLKIMCASNKSEELINKLYDWFKSLKDRVQPKQEWSEEDENIRLRLIDYLYGKSRLTKDREDGISWLKCLKDRVQPQNAWKPSKEQMNTLDKWLKDNQYKGDARYCYPIINSLYKDLLKLMEK